MKNFGLKTNKLHRIIAATICVVMLLGLVFQVTLFSAPEGEEPKPEQAVTRVADASTIDSWQEYYKDETDTSNVGKIWTDKTVVDGNVNLTSPDEDSELIPIERKDKNNFMVGLSALSSSKTFTLEAVIPVDVMFVLDISGSMAGENMVNLVAALNESIQEILAMNTENRVGVVLYSGAKGNGTSLKSMATCVFPLDRYTTTEADKTYFRNVDNGFAIEISKGVQNSAKESMYDPEHPAYGVGGNTYIQNGLLQAFEKMVPKTMDNAEKRIPIVSLMSDGDPTAASENYTESGDSTMGEGNKSDIRITFLTQLTAAWIKKNLESKYNNVKPLFYTIGLLPDSSKNEYARAVLDPQNGGGISGLDKWWNTFFEAEENEEITLEEGSQTITIQKKDNSLDVDEKSRYYVDEFYNSESSDGLRDAFKKLVKKIKIQTADAPTEVLPTGEKENLNYSGYLVFEDSLGKYMEVKNVAGVTYAGNLHTGIGFAEKMQTDGTADANEKKAFLESLQKRLEIDEETANTLLENAQTTGQISYKGAQETASNYIGWYADEGGRYIAPYINGKDIPENAKLINKSYFYYGNSEGTISEEKMMYLGVRIEKNMETGEEKMYFFIPASLIPLVQYNMCASFSEPQKVQTEKVPAYPVRLFYEVGVKSGINEYNLQQVKEDDLQYVGTEKQGRTGTFYQSLWTVDGQNKEASTVVDFTPSDDNEYYYYTSDSPIYIKDENGVYQKYEGNEKPSIADGEKYYFEKDVGDISEEAKEAKKMFALPDIVFAKIEKSQNGSWIIPKGTFREELLYEEKKDSAENTDTASYVSKTIIAQQDTSNSTVNDVRVLFGNNGKIILRQGKIQVTKKISIPKGVPIEEDKLKDIEFPFQMEFKTGEKEIIYGSDGFHQIENGSVNFQLKDGESIDFWLPSGIELAVEEIKDSSDPFKVEMTIAQNGNTNEPIQNEKIESLFIFSESLLEVNVENEYNLKPTNVNFFKVDGQGEKLSGAKFNLYKLDCDDPTHEGMHEKQILYVGAEPNCWIYLGCAESNGITGRLAFLNDDEEEIGFIKGIYRLVETEAPDGYAKPVGQWNIMINPGTPEPIGGEEVLGEQGEKPSALQISEMRVEITNYEPIDPPITGGRGIDRFLILGVAVAVSGLMLTIHLMLQRKRGKL